MDINYYLQMSDMFSSESDNLNRQKTEMSRDFVVDFFRENAADTIVYLDGDNYIEYILNNLDFLKSKLESVKVDVLKYANIINLIGYDSYISLQFSRIEGYFDDIVKNTYDFNCDYLICEFLEYTGALVE